MSRISVSHTRPCSGEKTLRRCRNNRRADNVIFIDVDSENFDNVIIIDVPESLSKKTQGSTMHNKDKKGSFGNVIYIDDDETTDGNHFTGVNNASFSAGTSSNRESCRFTKNIPDSAVSVEECQFVPDNATPVRLSKCKRTYSGKFCPRNRYGLDTDSESDSSDYEHPDCELVEDVSGKVQEQWEKAFSRRRKDIHNSHSGIRDDDSTSPVNDRDHHQNVEKEEATGKHKEASFCCSTEKSDDGNDAPSPFRTTGDTDLGYNPLSDDPTIHLEKTHWHSSNSDVLGRSNCQATGSPLIFDEQVDHTNCEPGSSSSHFEERGEVPGSCNGAFQEQSTKEFDHPAPAFKDEKTSKVEPCAPKFESCVGNDSCYGKSGPLEDEATACESKSSFQTEIRPCTSFPGDGRKNFQEEATGSVMERDHLQSRQPHATGSAKDMENLMPERYSFKRSLLPDKQTDHSSRPSCAAVGSLPGESFSSKYCFGSGDDILKGYRQENSQQLPVTDIHLNETKHQDVTSMSNIPQDEDKDGQLDSQDGDTLPSAETCIINDREKLKETDEYKRAIEEEWASRQQALQIQAEEAQRLRRLQKRRKAESMRLLDMERRQKQRLEEMRNAQKEDEENMNLKENIRAEVRKELTKLETTCPNMASLLHLLGIRVGGWPNPLTQEVQTAYKRALLTFHPDRALKSDIRRQVEAEEKFKLINRLKEKFSPSLTIK